MPLLKVQKVTLGETGYMFKIKYSCRFSTYFTSLIEDQWEVCAKPSDTEYLFRFQLFLHFTKVLPALCILWNGVLERSYGMKYSQTCIKRPPKGSLKSGLLIQVVS